MKKINVVPFRKFWQDCFNCIVYSLIDYTFHVPDLYYYNNMYTYKITEETARDGDKEILYISATPWTDNFRLIEEITREEELQFWETEKDVIGYIKKALDEDKVVLAAVDLFYWIDEGLHYHHNHISHMSLVIGYDDDIQKMYILETGNGGFTEFCVTYDCAIEAIQHTDFPTRVLELNKDAAVKMYDKADLAFYAKDVIKSIDEIVEKKDQLWAVEEVSEEGLYEVLSILQTHIFSMQNRAEIDAYLFENAFESDVIDNISLSEEFLKNANAFEKLKGVCIKLQHRKNRLEGIHKLKDNVFELLKKNRNLWSLYIEKNDLLCMRDIK